MEAETSWICNIEVEKWTVEKLKFWLKCRRLNQQGNQKQLLKKQELDLRQLPVYVYIFFIVAI